MIYTGIKEVLVYRMTCINCHTGYIYPIYILHFEGGFVNQTPFKGVVGRDLTLVRFLTANLHEFIFFLNDFESYSLDLLLFAEIAVIFKPYYVLPV